MKKNNGVINAIVHPRVDACTLGGIAFKLIKEGKKPEDVDLLALLTAGDEATMLNFENIEIIDRGGGDLDHHILGRSERGETSASLMARKLGMLDDKDIQKLNNTIRKHDLEGITDPFTFCHLIKAAQKNSSLTDKERMLIGVRAIIDALEFRKRGLQRENLWVQKILVQFLEEQENKFVPEDFQRYRDLLNNPKFQRLFDFVEILVAEKEIRGEDEAIKFAKTIIQLIYKHCYNHYKANVLVSKTPYKHWSGKILVIANNPDDPDSNDKDVMAQFSPAARRWARMNGRSTSAAVVIQHTRDGSGTQISFDTGASELVYYSENQFIISEELIQDIVAALRYLECIYQGRMTNGVDLAAPNTIPHIPEWHFAAFPAISGKRPGRLILNRSLTVPDVPLSKIPFPALFSTVCRIVDFQPLDWERWKRSMLIQYARMRPT